MQIDVSRALRAGPLLAAVALFAALAPGCKGNQSLRSQQPQIDVTPAALTIQPLPVGKSSIAIVQVRNSGNADLHFRSAPALAALDDAGNTGELTLASNLDHDCAGASRSAPSVLVIPPGECARVIVQYAPANLDKDTGELKLETDDPDRPVVKVPIALGDAAPLTICALDDAGKQLACDSPAGAPPTVPFGHSAKGSTVARVVRLKNDGKSTLDISAVSDPGGPMKSEFARDISGVPSKLQAGATADVKVTFASAGGGNRTAWLQIDSSDPVRPSVQVPLQGLGDGPGLCVDPSPVDFGSTSIGTPVSKTVTFTSCGTAPVQIQNIDFDKLTPIAFSSPSLPGPQTLAPNASVTATLRFNPDTAGDLQGALLTKTPETPDAFVLLKGTAVDAPVCRLGSSVTTLDFGQVVRGQFADRTVTLANRGKLDCHLSGMAISLGGSYFSVRDPIANPVTLRPGDVFSFTLRYAPPASDTNASDSGQAEATSDDPVTPKLDIQLTANASAAPECKLQVTPQKAAFPPPLDGRILQFGNVTVGRSKVLPVTFKNAGSADCNVTKYKLTNLTAIFGGCSNAGCAGYSVVPPLPQNPIKPGQSTQITVAFKPVDTNQLSFLPDAYLDVETSDANNIGAECNNQFPPVTNTGCAEVGLVGQGIVSTLVVLPDDLDFGLVTLGCKSKTESVTLYNTGNGPFTVKSLRLDPQPSSFYVVAPPTPFTMKPGDKVPLQITYRPGVAAKESATLYIESDASNTTSNNPYITVALGGTGTTDKHQVDSFTQASVPKVDMLFVIDDSGSFGFYQDQISQQAAKFINVANQYKADYQIGVCANDPKQAQSDKKASYPGVTIYPGGLYGQPGIVTNSTPDPVTAFSKNVKIGTGSDASREAGLDLAFKTLSAPGNQSAPPNGSKGFLRDDARLLVIDVQDDDDESQATVGFYVDFFQNLKGRYNAGLVSFNAIGAFDPQTGQPSQCIANDTEPGGQRYYDVAQATGGKTWSICNADWGAIANDLALGAFSGRKQFALARYADPSTLVVTMNGAPQTKGADYTYDQPSNSLVFAQVPPAGATIIAAYDALCF